LNEKNVQEQLKIFLSRHGWLCGLFLVGLMHRVAQWMVLREGIDKSAGLNGNVLLIQLLPAQLWREHFWAALQYLQQSPPLPNIIYGLIVRAFDTAQISTILILLCSLLSCFAILLMALQLNRLGFSRAFSSIVSLVFFVSADLLMMDYFAFGQSFYEQLTMLLVLLASLSATAVVKSPVPNVRALLLLGITVALLALTRATFACNAVVMLDPSHAAGAHGDACFIFAAGDIATGWLGVETTHCSRAVDLGHQQLGRHQSAVW